MYYPLHLLEDMRRLQKMLAQISKSLLTKKIQTDIQKWVNAYTVEHSPKTVCNAHGFLASVLAVYEPFMRLRTKLPQAKTRDLYTSSDSDISQVLKYIAGSEMEKAVLLAAFGTLRHGEIYALSDKVLKQVYRNVISDEVKKFTDKINFYFASIQQEYDMNRKNAAYTAFSKWTWRELNPRPKAHPPERLPSQSLFWHSLRQPPNDRLLILVAS